MFLKLFLVQMERVSLILILGPSMTFSISRIVFPDDVDVHVLNNVVELVLVVEKKYSTVTILDNSCCHCPMLEFRYR